MRSLYSDKHRSRLSGLRSPFLGGRSAFSLLSWSAKAREAFPLAAVAINSGAQVKGDRGESAAERETHGTAEAPGGGGRYATERSNVFRFRFWFRFCLPLRLNGGIFAIVSAQHFPYFHCIFRDYIVKIAGGKKIPVFSYYLFFKVSAKQKQQSGVTC